MSDIREYNPAEVSVIVGSGIMSGFADGSFVTIAYNEDAWSLYMGTDGSATRAKSNNNSGKITIQLAQSSPSNAFLSALAIADRLSNAGAVPVLIKDGNGDTTLFSAKAAWVVKMPDSEYARETGTREWVLETHDLNGQIGGYNEVEVQQ